MVILLITLMSAIGANAAEAYACYTPDNTTFTFYYDDLRSTRPGTTYDLNTGTSVRGWYTDKTYSKVTKVVFDPSFAGATPTTTNGWFDNMENLKTIEGMRYLNTSEVTNMAWMFASCRKLTDLDLSHFNTAKVTNMARLFSGCTKLTSLDLSHFNTSKVTSMNYMFSASTNLRTIYVGDGWNMAAVTDDIEIFSKCTSLVGGQGTIYDANHVDKEYAHIDGGSNNPGYFTAPPEAYACYTPENTTLTFYYDYQRSTRPGTTYDLNTGSNLPGWQNEVFCGDVTNVIFHSSFAGATPTSTYSWFNNMVHLETIEGMRYLDTGEVTNMAWMFCYCYDLTSLNLSLFYTPKVKTMEGMFNECLNLQTIYVGDDWTTNAVTSSSDMFYNCLKLEGDQGTTWKDSNPKNKIYAHLDGGTNNPGYFSVPPEAYAWYSPSNTTLTFCNDYQRSTRSGTTYDLNWDTDLPGWLTDGTYEYVTKVVFNPLFAGARPSTTYGWLANMENLESIEGLSYLNTCEVINMEGMFSGSPKLKILNLSHFNTSKVTKMAGMFWGCSDLQTIYVGDGWNTEAVTKGESMFYDCSSLVGGKGTKYDESHQDMTYAHIDGGPTHPGYFTAPPVEIATNIENGQRDAVKVQSEEWFTIDGQKLSGKPTKKGVYIHNGRAVVL